MLAPSQAGSTTCPTGFSRQPTNCLTAGVPCYCVPNTGSVNCTTNPNLCTGTANPVCTQIGLTTGAINKRCGRDATVNPPIPAGSGAFTFFFMKHNDDPNVYLKKPPVHCVAPVDRTWLCAADRADPALDTGVLSLSPDMSRTFTMISGVIAYVGPNAPLAELACTTDANCTGPTLSGTRCVNQPSGFFAGGAPTQGQCLNPIEVDLNDVANPNDNEILVSAQPLAALPPGTSVIDLVFCPANNYAGDLCKVTQIHIVTLSGGDTVCANPNTFECQGAQTSVHATALQRACGETTGGTPFNGADVLTDGSTRVGSFQAPVSSSLSCQVNVVDTSNPSISCSSPAAVHTSAQGGSCSASINPSAYASATDQCFGTLQASCNADPLSVSSGDALSLEGTQRVRKKTSVCDALDGVGHSAGGCSVALALIDDTNPSVSCPAAQNAVECTGNNAADVTVGAASASDNCDTVSASCDHGSGSYPLGSTNITCSASDLSSNPGSCNTGVTVVDTLAPEITCTPSIFVKTSDLNGACETNMEVSAEAIDQCSPNPSVNCDLSQLSLTSAGSVSTTCHSNDGHGHTASCDVSLTLVDDSEVPEAKGAELWPPNHKYRKIGLKEHCGITFGGACGGGGGSGGFDPASAKILSVSSDEIELGPGVGSGNTTQDIKIVDKTHVNLRSEREGTGDGRVYTIHFSAKNASNQLVFGDCLVTVPHDQGTGPRAVDSGAKYSVPGLP